MNYIRKHWRGELSLAISFWVNVFLINIALLFLNYWLVQNSPINHPVISARVTIIIVIIKLFIFAWQIVGLWRACDRHVAANGRAFWARTAQAIVVLGLIASLGSISAYWGTYKALYQIGFQKDTTYAYTLTLRNNDSIIHLEGGLSFGASKDVAALLKDHPDIKGIILDCVGGMFYEGRELSKLILVYGLDTYSLKGCYSAGTMAFISGTNRFLGTEASLGFHQYHLHYEGIDKFVNLEKEQGKDLRIFKRKGIKKEFLEKLYAASDEDLWFPSRDELLSAGVIHGVVNPSDLTLLERTEDINVKKVLLDMPVFRTMQKYEPEVFEQIITDANEQYKNGATLIELQETGANHSQILANRLLPMSSDETLIRFGQISVGMFRNLVKIDPILCLKYLYPQQYGAFVFSKYISHDVLESLNEVLQNIIIDAYEKESTPIDTEAVELQMQKLVLQHKDDVEYIVIGHEKLQNSDQYKRYCDALIRFYELILTEDKRIAANMLRYLFTLDAADGSATDGNASDDGNYDGDIVDGKKHGYGTYTFANGNKYTGEFKNDKVDGQGTYTWASGTKYVGEWRDNKKNGQGTQDWADGTKYVGEWENNEATGQGTATYPNGEKYVGEWKNGVRSGSGTNTQLDGEKYVGEWKNNVRSGSGTNSWPDGEKYVGEFKDNNAIGGWYYLADGSREWAYTDAQGNWKFQTEADGKLNDVIHNDGISQSSKEQLDVAMCSDFEWSDNPGAYEAHLIRRCNNPYFPAHLQAVSEEELLEARAIDNNDYLLAEEQLAQLVKSFEALDSFITVEETNKLRERIDDLILFSIGVGGRANQIAKAADFVREALISTMREAFSNDQDVLETIEKADGFHKKYVRKYNIPVIAQMLRERSPIRTEDVVATILSEDPETIANVMSLLTEDEDFQQQIQQAAAEMMEKAREQGYIDNYFEEKLSALVAVAETIVSKQDAEYIVKGVDIDTDTGELKPDIPQNETQSVLSNMMKEYNQLNMDTSDKISNIRPFEFTTFTELKIKDDVLQLKNNLQKYIDIRTAYYDSMGNLLKKYRGELNYGSKQDERLSGTAAQFMEKLEVKYVNDLNEFYEFILSHHEKMNFAEDQIYIEDQALVNNLNTLFEKAVKSATEFTSAQEIGQKTMGDSVKEWQNEINAK